MSAENLIVCDGCGQAASPQHTARRLQRLEWSTRYRPIHMQTLLLGAVSPDSQAEFLYSPEGPHEREAAQLFKAVGIAGADKTADALHSEFQRHGLFLTHALECPLETDLAGAGTATVDSLLALRLPLVLTRIRRSLKPKRVALISASLAPHTGKFSYAQLGCELLLDGGRPFELDNGQSVGRLREALAVPAVR